jgi:hypothetical protein
MRALVVEPHDVNELIFASYLSHPFLYMARAAIFINEGESTEVGLKILFTERERLDGYQHASR